MCVYFLPLIRLQNNGAVEEKEKGEKTLRMRWHMYPLPRCISTASDAVSVTSAVALGVLGEAADHRLHRLLQHRRVPGVTVAGGPRPQSGADAAVQAVELQRRRRRRRPG